MNDILGWLGVSMILTAYILVTSIFIGPSSVSYQLLNLVGAALVASTSFRKKDYQPMLLNIVWVCVALIGLFGILI